MSDTIAIRKIESYPDTNQGLTLYVGLFAYCDELPRAAGTKVLAKEILDSTLGNSVSADTGYIGMGRHRRISSRDEADSAVRTLVRELADEIVRFIGRHDIPIREEMPVYGYAVGVPFQPICVLKLKPEDFRRAP